MKKSGFAALAASLSLFLGCMSVSAQDEKMTVNLGSYFAEENNTAQVSISLENNTGISAYSIELCYDPEKLVFDSASSFAGTDKSVFYCNGNYSEGSVKLVWSDHTDYYGENAATVRFIAKNGSADKETFLSIGNSEFINSAFEKKSYNSKTGSVKVIDKINSGDVDLNDKVEVLDVVVINKHIVDSENYPFDKFKQQANSDVNSDGVIDLSDSQIIIDHICGIGRRQAS